MRPYACRHSSRPTTIWRGGGVPESEVLVVDDGSRDGTGRLIREWEARWPRLRALGGGPNRGKGAAVREGFLASRGRYVLFCDADGATPIAEEAALREAIGRGADVAVGSRFLAPALARRDRLRGMLGRAFAACARRALAIPARDTQCGFKMFRADSAQRLFRPCEEEGYAFDLFVLALAVRIGLRVEEVGVSWSEVPGSKVRLIRDSLRMVRGIARIRRALRPLPAAPRFLPEPAILAAAPADPPRIIGGHR